MRFLTAVLVLAVAAPIFSGCMYDDRRDDRGYRDDTRVERRDDR